MGRPGSGRRRKRLRSGAMLCRHAPRRKKRGPAPASRSRQAVDTLQLDCALRRAGGFAGAAAGALSQPLAGGLTVMGFSRGGFAGPGCTARRGPPRNRGRPQRLLVKPARDVVALLGRVLVTLRGGEREPLVGFGQVLV